MPEADDLTQTAGDEPRTYSGRPRAALRERPPGRAERALPVAASPPLAASEPAFALELCADLAAIEGEWRAFEAGADCTVFQSFEWVAIWQQHIGAPRGTVPVIVLAHDEGGLLFLLPLAIETRAAVRRLTWLASELCDYNAPMLAPHFAHEVGTERFIGLWRDILALLRADPRFHFDLVDLPKMPEMVGTQRNPFLDLPVRANPSGAYVATLATDWETFYAAKRSSSTRKRERRQFKQLAEHGTVRFVDVRDGPDLNRTLTTLIEQKSRSFARMGVEDLFERPGYQAFYVNVAREGSALTHVSRLDVGDVIAAASLGLKFRDCYYLVLSSYHDGDIARFGPGRAHLHELLRHAIDNGFCRFDFTIGDEPYKRDWSDIEVRLWDHLEVVTPRAMVAVALMAAYRRVKRFIKQTPAVWRAFSTLRGFFGRR